MKQSHWKRTLNYLLTLTALAGMGLGQVQAAKYPLAEKVNPFIGTDAHGHTYPGAATPFGMVQLSPDTGTDGWDWCSGYHYTDSSIMGFSHTHLDGTGCADLGDFLFMPGVGELKFKPGSKRNPDEGYRSRFSHAQEKASAGYYSVFLQDSKIAVELTATPRVGVHKYTFPATDSAHVIIDLAHHIGGSNITECAAEIVGDKQVKGYVRKRGWSPDRFLYFVADFSRPFNRSGIAHNGELQPGDNKSSDNRNTQLFVGFDTTQERELIVKVALSAVSWEGAAKNMQAECPGWDFAAIVDQAQNAWQEKLASITVQGSTEDDQTVFYTALYRCFLTPNIFIDADRQYRGTDKQIHTAEGFDNYTIFSLWDVFRAQLPLFTIIDQQRTNDFINSMLNKYKQNGLLPFWELHSGETWCMIGYHAIPPIADAWMKGIRGFDINLAMEAMKKSALQDHQGLKSYKELGYIALNNDSQSVSRTVEYAYDDWCIYQVAKEQGRTDDMELFNLRSQFYRNLFDRSIGFIRGKDINGAWRSDFDPDQLSSEGARDFTEGNSWHYTFFAPHDVNGLIELLGGDKGFTAKMDELFTRPGRAHVDVSGLIGQYAQGNEPCHNFAYLYAYAGEPYKSQQRVSQICTELFTNTPDGVCGNNDCGQMSAWFVFSALGFYPVCPGEPIYVFGSPRFPEAQVNLESGKSFKVTAKNVSPENIYIQSVSLNGRKYTKSYIAHTDIMNGGELSFVMGNKPNLSFGKKPADRPSSNPGKSLTLMPYIASDELGFLDTITAEIKCDDSNAKIYYTLDGSEPTTSSMLYSKPITATETTTIKARAFKAGSFPSMILSSNLMKLVPKPALKVEGLVNGLNCEIFQGDFSSVRQLGRANPVKKVQASDVTVKVTDLKDNFGLRFTGYYLAPTDGLYTFGTISDDGSALLIDSEMIVNNDGYHGEQAKYGKAALKAGLHKIQVLYFEGSVTEQVHAFVQVPGGKMTKIPTESYFRQK